MTIGINDFKLSNNVSAMLSFKTENVLGTDYQTIAYHPMPGRSFLLGLSLQWNRNRVKYL
jgi:outer membrane cobalamin receptor